jgi:tetratricopeptide (TPR) repeat protein
MGLYLKQVVDWSINIMSGSLVRAGAFVAAVVVAGCAVNPREQGAATPVATKQVSETKEVSAPPSPATAPTSSLPADVMYKVLVAEVALQRGHYDVAIKNYLQLGEARHDPRLLERAARIAVYAHDDKHALEAARLWVKLEPDNVDAREVVTAFYIRSGQYDKAQKQLEALLALNKGKGGGNAFMLIAGLLGRQQDKQAALDVMQRLVNTRPNDPNALVALSHLAVRAGVLDKAEQAIKRVVALEPDRVDANVQLARILAMRGKSSESLKLLKTIVKKHPKDVNLRTIYARSLEDDKQTDKAYAQFKIVDKQSPGNPEILRALGLVAVELGHVGEGEKYFLRLSRSSPAYESESSYYLGRIAEEYHKNPDMAIKWYSRVDQNSNNYLESQIRIALLLAQKGEVDQARGQLSAITPQGPGELVRIYLADGQILRSADRPQEAVEVYTSGLKELPDNADLLYARAMTEEKIGQFGMMEKDLKRILARDPDNVDALNALGYSLADRTQRYKEALGYIKRALQLRPDSYFVLDSMGWVHYRLGHYQQAVSYLRRALDASSDSEIAAHLTEVLWVMGNKQAAREVWDKALKVAPGNKTLLDVMNRLDHK